MRYLSVCVRLSVVASLAAFAGGCSDPAKARAEAGIRPTYDTGTGRLKQLALDSNHDGHVETWTDMDGARPIQTRIDRNEDGKLDRWEYYDQASRLIKVGFSRNDDGKPDAWAFSGPDGKVERIEISTVADENKIDRFERYDASGLVAATEDTNADGGVDKWETYHAGALTTAAFDEDHDGKPDRRLTYDGATLVSIETAPDPSGRFVSRVDVR
jgi:hypothetical protein